MPDPRTPDPSGGGRATPGGPFPDRLVVTTRRPDTVRVMDLDFDNLPPAEAAAVIGARADEKPAGLVVTPNVDILRSCRNDPELARLVTRSDYVVPDGAPLITASRLAGTPLRGRVAGADLMWGLAAEAVRRDWQVGLIGGPPGAATAAAARMTDQLTGLRATGLPLSFSAEHDDGEVAALARTLIDQKARIVFLGLGFPRQERFAHRLLEAGVRAWFVGVGAGIEFAAATKPRAPRWLQGVGLEWSYRLAAEPSRLWRRYLVDGIPFAVRLHVWALRERSRRRSAPEPAPAAAGPVHAAEPPRPRRAGRRPEGRPEPLRIGYVCGALRVTTDSRSVSTGPRAHVTGMLAGLAEAGCDVRRYLAGDRAPEGLAGAGSGERMRGGRLRGLAVDAARLGTNPLFGVAARRAVGPVDVLYERQATMQSLGAYRRRGQVWVVESNGPFWYEASVERGTLALVGAAKRLELECYRRADLVVAVSEPLKEIICQEAGLDPERVLVVPNAVDPDRFAPRPADRAARPDGPVVVGFVGHLIEWAGLGVLLEALAAARRQGAPVEALVVGHGPAAGPLRERAAALGVQDAVRFTGLRPWTEVPDLLAGCDLAYSGQVRMSVGHMYHSPLKLYEYAAAGLPLLASDHADARSLVAPSGAGWLVPPGDVDAVTAALVDACRRRRELPALGRRARAHVLAGHTWAARATSLLDALAVRGLVDPARVPARRTIDLTAAEAVAPAG